jgi:copper chaperone CopZ
MATYELRVTGMTCGSCESIVEQRVGNIDGVQSVDANANAESVVVEGKDGLGKAIAKRIQNTGYDVVN